MSALARFAVAVALAAYVPDARSTEPAVMLDCTRETPKTELESHVAEPRGGCTRKVELDEIVQFVSNACARSPADRKCCPDAARLANGLCMCSRLVQQVNVNVTCRRQEFCQKIFEEKRFFKRICCDRHLENMATGICEPIPTTTTTFPKTAALTVAPSGVNSTGILSVCFGGKPTWPLAALAAIVVALVCALGVCCCCCCHRCRRRRRPSASGEERPTSVFVVASADNEKMGFERVDEKRTKLGDAHVDGAGHAYEDGDHVYEDVEKARCVLPPSYDQAAADRPPAYPDVADELQNIENVENEQLGRIGQTGQTGQTGRK